MFEKGGVAEMAARLEMRRAELGLTRDQLRAKGGVGTSQIISVLDGHWANVKWETIEKVIRTLDWNVDHLLASLPGRSTEPPGVHSKLDSLMEAQGRVIALLEPTTTRSGLSVLEPPPAAIPERMLSIPLYGKVAAGVGAVNRPRSRAASTIQVPERLRPARDGELIAVKVRGASMEPELSSGDTLIVWYPKRQPAFHLLKDGALVVLTMRGSGDDFEDIVKYYTHETATGRDMLLSANPDFGHQEMPDEQDIVYIGWVRQVIKRG